MSFEEKLKLINTFDGMIRKRVRGNAVNYASKLGISRSAFFRLLDCMRSEFNIPIIYKPEIQCYGYAKDGMMFVGFISSHILPLESLKKINGGNYSENNLFIFVSPN